jgi:group I intron endonuclease
MSVKGSVYVITNVITGKMYVGQTVQQVSARIRKHMSNAKSDCRVLVNNIKKYGRSNFKVEVVSVVDQAELNSEERKWISKLNTMVPHGLNLTSGGDGGGSASSETRLRQSKSMKAYASRPEVRQHKRNVWANKEYKQQRRDERKLIQNKSENVASRRLSWDKKRIDAIALEKSPDQRRRMWRLARNNARQGVRKAIRRGVCGRDLWAEFHERWLDDCAWKAWIESDEATLPRGCPLRTTMERGSE